MVSVVKNLNLRVSADMIKPIMQLFDEDGSGTVDYQEFFALIFYFRELEYLYAFFRLNSSTFGISFDFSFDTNTIHTKIRW
jgi:Ca2+-binding EF-hand superfamily protein